MQNTPRFFSSPCSPADMAGRLQRVAMKGSASNRVSHFVSVGVEAQESLPTVEPPVSPR